MLSEGTPLPRITQSDIDAAQDCKIRTHVRLSGISRIHPRVISKDMETIKRCDSIRTVDTAMEEIKQRWINLGIFKSVEHNFEPTKDGGNHDVCVHIDVEECRPKKSIGVFTTDTSLPEVTVALENILGGKYSVKGNYIPPASNLHSLSFSLLSNVPFLGQTAEYNIGRRTQSQRYQLGDVERIDEMKATTSNHKGDMSSHFTVGFQRRAMVSKDPDTVPAELRPDFSPTNKGFIKHEFQISKVAYHANPFLYQMYPLPIFGRSLMAVNEVAGGIMAGDAAFFKSELQGTTFWPLGPYLSCQWSNRVAGIYPFLSGRIPLNDRLFLGNSHVRGFKSIGPSNVDDGKSLASRFAATGGNALWATSLNVNFPMPYAYNNGFAAMHVFANAGGLRMINCWEDFKDLGSWFRSTAMSVGCGIVITRLPLFGVAPSGRMEINCSLPIGLSEEKQPLFDKFRFGLVWSSECTT